MTDNSVDFDGMIQVLEAKKAALDEAIESLKRARDAVMGLGITAARSGEIAVDQFTGLNLTDATEKFLTIVGRPARTTQEIVEGLAKGGLDRVSQDSVATMLLRSHNSEGPVVRVQKGLWGLATWYPKRPPKIKRAKNGEIEEHQDDKIEAVMPEDIKEDTEDD